MLDCSGHLDSALDFRYRKPMVACMIAAIAENTFCPRPDGLACTGISGLLWATPLSDALDIPLIVVRKAGEYAHSSLRIESGINMDRQAMGYLVIDDFVDTGDTIRTIRAKIASHRPAWKCLGVLCAPRRDCTKVYFRLPNDSVWGPEYMDKPPFTPAQIFKPAEVANTAPSF